mgnify:CR=1 FL=1
MKIRVKKQQIRRKMNILVRNEGNMREMKVGPQKFTNLKKNNKEVGYRKEKDEKGTSRNCTGAVK